MFSYLLLFLSVTFMYSQEQCTSNDNIPYDNGGNLDYCFDGTTGCDCTDECGGNAQSDDCDNCVGGSTGLSINHFEDECGVCGIGATGPGPQIPCWDGSYECNENDCPFNKDDCPPGTEGMEEYLLNTNVCVPDSFLNVIQSTVQAYYYFENVSIDGEPVDVNDWVGAFYGDICVGAQLWDTTLCVFGICEVTIMGNDSQDVTDEYCTQGDEVTFKIYDTDGDTYHDATPSENFPWSSEAVNQIDYLIAGDLNTDTGLLFPDNYHISNIYPNPFNPVTSIEYSISENAAIELVIYNIHGRQIQTLVQGLQIAGYHSINWNASNYPSGIYLIQLASGKHIETKKIILIK